jgi:hypothetical protein
METVIKRVTSAGGLRRFIRFPYHLYQGNPYWCPQLRRGERNTLSRKKNPSFEYCEAEYWLAYQGRKVVGRIAGIINRTANERWNVKRVRFGWIDFIDDPAVSSALVETVMNWGRSRGMDSIHGPMGFSCMDNKGMLIKGFEELATLGSIYNYPYYPVHMARLGFEKSADFVQYIMPAEPIPEKVERLAALVSEKYGIRPLRVKRSRELLPYAGRMWDLLNTAFKEQYGFTPLTPEQATHYTKKYFPFLHPDFVGLLVNRDDEVTGFGIAIPSLTRALQRCGGRLFPFGFLHILRALKKNDLVDLNITGVAPRYQGKGIVSIYLHELQKGFIRHQIKTMVTNPQLEDNVPAIMWKIYQGRQHISRRCWIKSL